MNANDWLEYRAIMSIHSLPNGAKKEGRKTGCDFIGSHFCVRRRRAERADVGHLESGGGRGGNAIHIFPYEGRSLERALSAHQARTGGGPHVGLRPEKRCTRQASAYLGCLCELGRRESGTA